MPRLKQHNEPQQVVRKVVTSSEMSTLGDVRKDIHALNSAIMMISQKIKYIVRNEKILGRNLLVMNRKVRVLSEGAGLAGADSEQLGNLRTEIQSLTARAEQNSAAIAELQSSVDTLSASCAKETELKEIKYVIDSINPLEFVTYKDVESLVEQKLKQTKK